ncbi:hypothetical protein HDV05_004375 [Chytridiales sp. JEL 0842]|nr:hypothetical protein HDV05_004375 [Chytridiales sp. JEL 0842]
MTGTVSNIIGLHVRIVLTNDVIHEGLIFAYEPTLGIVVLQSPSTTPASSSSSASSAAAPSNTSNGPSASSSNSKHDFHLLKVGVIKEATQTSNNALIHLDELGSVAAEGSGSKTVPVGYKDLVQVGPVNVEKMAAKHYQAVKAENERMAKIGVGVSETAQIGVIEMAPWLSGSLVLRLAVNGGIFNRESKILYPKPMHAA